MKTVEVDLSEAVFNGATVAVHLCDNTFKSLRVVIYLYSYHLHFTLNIITYTYN